MIPKGRVIIPGACHDPQGACHDPLGACHYPQGACHYPQGACHYPLGACHDPLGACHDQQWDCHDFSSKNHLSIHVRYEYRLKILAKGYYILCILLFSYVEHNY